MAILTEQYGQREETLRSFVEDDVTGKIRCISKQDGSQRMDSFWGTFRDVFLPQGYPDSVTEDYLEYQAWDTLQAFSSSISGTLATEAVLKGE